jgi:hypothetical protein
MNGILNPSADAFLYPMYPVNLSPLAHKAKEIGTIPTFLKVEWKVGMWLRIGLLLLVTSSAVDS